VSLLSCLWSFPDLQAVGQLRWLGLGGEPLPLPLVGQLQQLMAQPQGVVNLYGPTETTCNSNHWVVPSGCQGPMVIGQPCANFLQYVVDPGSLALLPVGAPGELLLSGPRVGAGYCGQPALTRERFIINPFKDQVSHHPWCHPPVGDDSVNDRHQGSRLMMSMQLLVTAFDDWTADCILEAFIRISCLLCCPPLCSYVCQ
jgi:non-ribosomal peptide synthetase component F